VARISGIDLPKNKRVEIALTSIFGIGLKSAQDICKEAKVDVNTKIRDLSENEVLRIRDIVSRYLVEGDLRRQLSQNVRRLQDIGSYRGIRHRKRLPVRGQRTHTNARTKKGKRVAIAGKKKVTK
jgi:small subunit ribosomal protein S13